MNIYEIKGTLLDLLYQAESGESEYSEDCLKDALEMVEGEFEDKVDAYCTIIRTLESDVEQLKEEKKRLAERQASIERNILRMKDVITRTASELGMKNVKTLHYTVNRFNAAKLDIFDKVPDEFKKEVPTVRKDNDTEAIKAALDAGEKLSFARYVSSCTIK